ncbi:MAG TPA: hypothetical protein VMP01_16545 [Pirellulaceae bacterium]|nr:hypothetical protein [Pirellulaceae bacterium]
MTITVAGRELACAIRRTAGGYEEWISDEVPFDGKVKDNSRSAYTLLDFGWEVNRHVATTILTR